MCGPRSRARLRCVRARLCGCCRARRVRVRFEMAWAGCACSSAVTCRDVSCTVCSERALSPVCCVCCAAAARARCCFTCATGCTIVSLFESLRQAGCLRPEAGGGCVSAWIVCDAVRGADCRVQCCCAGRASGWRCRGRGLVARARVQGRGVASVSRAGRARGVAARRRRGPPFSVTWTFRLRGHKAASYA